MADLGHSPPVFSPVFSWRIFGRSRSCPIPSFGQSRGSAPVEVFKNRALVLHVGLASWARLPAILYERGAAPSFFSSPSTQFERGKQEFPGNKNRYEFLDPFFLYGSVETIISLTMQPILQISTEELYSCSSKITSGGRYHLDTT